MPPLSTTPLPTPVPSPRRPPVPAGVLRVIAVLSVIGLGYILSGGSRNQDGEGLALQIGFDPSFPSPLIRAATPQADGFEVPPDPSSAIATGIVTTADPDRGLLVLLHKIPDQSGKLQYFRSRYRDARDLLVTVGDPVARAQKIAEALTGEVSVSALSIDSGKNIEIPVQEFLRKYPLLASSEYAIPPFPAHGGGQLPVIIQPPIVPEMSTELESP